MARLSPLSRVALRRHGSGVARSVAVPGGCGAVKSTATWSPARRLTCRVWVTARLLSRDQAYAALRAAVPDLDYRLKEGQIEIVDFSQWYTRNGRQDAAAEDRLV